VDTIERGDRGEREGDFTDNFIAYQVFCLLLVSFDFMHTTLQSYVTIVLMKLHPQK
jgi:hypothetical protein